MSVLVTLCSRKVCSATHKTVICLFEQAALFGGEAGVVALVNGFYSCKELFVECYVVLVGNIQLLHLLFNGKYLVIAACIGNGIERAYYIAKQQACIVKCCNCVVECCGIAVVAYGIYGLLLACYCLLDCRDVMLQCYEVIWNCTMRGVIWHQEWIHINCRSIICHIFSLLCKDSE